ncbi:MAG: hypothetical protein IJX67_00830 [Oscillospiraceae bacterium]|nr:hypothetical protein [Oscillospiraceae bacterium]
MDEELNQTTPEEHENTPQQESYQPRPRWQVWGARFLVVVFIVLVIIYYINIGRGGL